MKIIAIFALILSLFFGQTSYANECMLPESLENGAIFKSFTVGSEKIKNAKILEIDMKTCWMKVVRVSLNREVWINLRLLSSITP